MEMLDRIKGGLMGVAIGDAMGGSTEFMNPEEIRHLYGRLMAIVGGGVWRLKPGEVTDDTEMTLCVARGILASPSDPIEKIGEEFIAWYNTNPKDIGLIIRSVIRNYKGDWFSAAEDLHRQTGKTAGNGSLMRTLPVALAYDNRGKMEEITRGQSLMTHFDPQATEACILYNRMAHRLLYGDPLEQVVQEEVKGTIYEENLGQKPDCPPDGYVVHTFHWVLYWLMNGRTFTGMITGAVNMGGDSDTIAAIIGGLMGIHVGYAQIPAYLSDKILLKEDLLQIAQQIYEIPMNGKVD